MKRSLQNFIKIQRAKMASSRSLYIFGFTAYVGAIGVWMYYNNFGSEVFPKMLTSSAGFVGSVYVPTFMRKFIYTKYANTYGVNLEEIEKPLVEYQTFSQFFTRKVIIKPEYQKQFANLSTLCCPCDSEILNISKVTSDSNIIVKQIPYSISTLLFQDKSQSIVEELKKKKQHDLYQVIFYLCPGDYHRFHSPFNVSLKARRSISGAVKPVNLKSLLSNGGIVYQKNARKVLHFSYETILGKNLYLGMVMVGALNVSDIGIKNTCNFKKGDEIGYFNLGSTIVLIFQAASLPKWNKKIGDKVKFGETLCTL